MTAAENLLEWMATLISVVGLSLHLHSNAFPLFFFLSGEFLSFDFHFPVLSVSFVISLHVDIWTLYAQSAKAINIHPGRMKLLLD